MTSPGHIIEIWVRCRNFTLPAGYISVPTRRKRPWIHRTQLRRPLACGPAGVAGVASLMMAGVAWPAAREVLQSRSITEPTPSPVYRPLSGAAGGSLAIIPRHAGQVLAPSRGRPVMVDMEVIVRRQDQKHCASITCMIRHYVARRAEVTEGHPHNADVRAEGLRGHNGR